MPLNDSVVYWLLCTSKVFIGFASLVRTVRNAVDALVKDGRLPPQASSSNPDAPDDLDAEGPRYQLTDAECKIYGAAIETRRKISISLYGWPYSLPSVLFT